MTSQDPRPFGAGPGEVPSYAIALHLYRQAEARKEKLLTPPTVWGRVRAWLRSPHAGPGEG